MGFYIRKSVSAGPFRFNLSKSGLGVSVGVKGLRLGAGPRGNYVHMGRGGLYYRASLNRPRQRQRAEPVLVPELPHDIAVRMQTVEIGDVLEMAPSNGSTIVDQINEKYALVRAWPFVLAFGLIMVVAVAGQPWGNGFAGPLLAIILILAAIAGYWDVQRKTVVLLYELDGDSEKAFEIFSRSFERLADARRIWNIDTAGATSDWKRNAGASRLINRKPAQLIYRAPTVVKTNVSVPALLGGRHNVYFFPDVVLIAEGKRVGAVSYQQLRVLWTDSVFLESDAVPADARVVGYSWQFVNKNGGPDRRFKNNREIPKVLYQQMGLESAGGFRKILQFSKSCDRGDFNAALQSLATLVRQLSTIAPEGEVSALLK